MLCQEQVAQLCDRWGDFHAAGTDVVVIGSGTPEQAGWLANRQSVPVRILTDPDLATFRATGARRGWASALRPGVFWGALRAWRRGFRQALTMGDPLQLGAVWIVAPGGEVLYRYTSTYAGDHPAPSDLLAALEQSPGMNRFIAPAIPGGQAP